MIKLERNKSMMRAIERARQLHPRVTCVNADERIYRVTGSGGGAYTVRFQVVSGLKLAECDCAGGRAGLLCKHVAAAAAVNIGIQSMRRGASAPAVPPIASGLEERRMIAFIARNSGWVV